MMKQRRISLFLCVAVMLLSGRVLFERDVKAYSAGPPTVRTGAPGEPTCALCHNSYPLNSGPAVLRLSGLPAAYTPKEELSLSFSITQPDRELFGFELTALDDAGRAAGTILVSDDFRTQMLLDSVGGNIRQYLYHTLPGTSPVAVGQGSWNFKWRAPETSVGRVTFYAVGNAANGNGGSSGDYISTFSASIDPPATTPVGYEADVAPRPNGSNTGAVTVADWVQIGRFASGLDQPAPGSEFQRADCAPLAFRGDGRISMEDWVQAGRFVAGLDPVVAAGGPTGTSSRFLPDSAVGPRRMKASVLRLHWQEDASATAWRWLSCEIELDAAGGENAISFSLQFDPARLWWMQAEAGADANGLVLNVNRAQMTEGRVGFGLALAPGMRFDKGTRSVLRLHFLAPLVEPAPIASVAFSDAPVARQIIDVTGAGRSADFVGRSRFQRVLDR